MNAGTEIIFAICWVILLVYAVRYSIMMFRVWGEYGDVTKPLPKTQNPFGSFSIDKMTVTKKPHPEMEDVQNGDELLVVKFDEPDQIDRSRFKLDSPELHNLGDPLHKSLQDRIEELNEDEDDDDDDGDVVINRK